jgi:cell division protein FtsL
MYQYGNVAVQYQKEKQKKPINKQNQQQHQHQQPHRNPVRPVISTGEKLLYILSIIVVVAVLSSLLMRMATISQYNYEIQSMERETAQIEERISNLQLEVATLSAPERIIKLAQDEWGMELNESTVRILSNPSTPEGDKENSSMDE